MHALTIKFADWFLTRCDQNLAKADRTKARSSLIVFLLFLLVALLDAVVQLSGKPQTLQKEVLLAHALLTPIMLVLLKCTGRYRLLVGSHLLGTQLIATGSMLQSGWAFDPMFALLPTRVVIAAYILDSRWSGALSLITVLLCYGAFRINLQNSLLLLPMDPILTSATLRMTANLLVAIFGVVIFSELYGNELQKESAQLAENRLRAFRAARHNRLCRMMGELDHHIKNPLAIVQAALYRLQGISERNDCAVPEHTFLLQHIDHSLMRIRYIIDELSLMSQNDRREPLRIESVHNICKNLVVMLGKSCQQPQIHLQVLDNTRNMNFVCRPHQLVRILSALVTNACEAVEPGKDLQIKVIIVASHSHIEFQILDSGPGVPWELERRLFEPFFTTKSARSHAGLSLAVARNILEEIGGSLTYEPLQQGAFFHVNLPLALVADKAGHDENTANSFR